MEPLLLLYMVLLSLAVGLLQHFPEIQAITAATLSTALTVFLAVANPFNESSRYYFEVLANGCLSGAFIFVALHKFIEFDNADVVRCYFVVCCSFAGV